MFGTGKLGTGARSPSESGGNFLILVIVRSGKAAHLHVIAPNVLGDFNRGKIQVRRGIIDNLLPRSAKRRMTTGRNTARGAYLAATEDSDTKLLLE